MLSILPGSFLNESGFQDTTEPKMGQAFSAYPPRASCSINCVNPLANVLFIDKNGNRLLNSRVNNFSIIIWVIKELFVHSHCSRISSYVALFPPAQGDNSSLIRCKLWSKAMYSRRNVDSKTLYRGLLFLDKTFQGEIWLFWLFLWL